MKSKAKMKKLLEVKDVRENCQQLRYLPEEIIFEILTKIPAAYLQKKFRYLCKSWHDLISSSRFVSENILQNRSELLVLNPTSQQKVLPFYDTTSLRIENKAQEFDFNLKKFPMGRMGEIRSSCNGLILVCHPKEKKLLYVMNVLTKSWLRLPNCPSDCSHSDCGMVLCFDPSTKEYKVVHIFSETYGFEIFTLGCSDNAWKRIPEPFKTWQEQIYGPEYQWQDPVCINEQVLYWLIGSNRFIISMNVSDNKSMKTCLPECCWRSDENRYELVEMGGNLAVVHKVSATQIDVWILQDCDGWEWMKKHSIMAETIIYTKDAPDFLKLCAVATLEDGEVLIFTHDGGQYVSDRLYLYNIKQGKLRKVRMKIKEDCKFIPHRSSLMSWIKNEKRD